MLQPEEKTALLTSEVQSKNSPKLAQAVLRKHLILMRPMTRLRAGKIIRLRLRLISLSLYSAKFIHFDAAPAPAPAPVC
jgi:hypothetical protein